MTRRGLVLVALLLAAFIINLDTTIVNVALPSLVRQLGASTTDLQWVVDAYNLVFAALVLAAGSLSDRLGRKGMLLAGLGLFGAASLAGAFGTSSGELITARAVMGLGAALIFPATLSLISNVFTERRERAKAIGLWGATVGVGIAMGPIVGGWLLEQFWWGSVFLFMVPISVIVLEISIFLAFAGGVRVFRRMTFESGLRAGVSRKRTLLVGSPNSLAGTLRQVSPPLRRVCATRCWMCGSFGTSGSPRPVARWPSPSSPCRASSSSSPSTSSS